MKRLSSIVIWTVALFYAYGAPVHVLNMLSPQVQIVLITGSQLAYATATCGGEQRALSRMERRTFQVRVGRA